MNAKKFARSAIFLMAVLFVRLNWVQPVYGQDPEPPTVAGMLVAEEANKLLGTAPYASDPADCGQNPCTGYYVCTDVVIVSTARAGVPITLDSSGCACTLMRRADYQQRYFKGESVIGGNDSLKRHFEALGSTTPPSVGNILLYGMKHVAVVVDVQPGGDGDGELILTTVEANGTNGGVAEYNINSREYTLEQRGEGWYFVSGRKHTLITGWGVIDSPPGRWGGDVEDLEEQLWIAPVSNPRGDWGFGVPTSFQSRHTGIDFLSPSGTEVHAVADAEVSWVDWWPVGTAPNGHGETVWLLHGKGPDGRSVYSVYAHLSQYRVQVGDSVSQGEVIGLTGNTGAGTGPHIHFAVGRKSPDESGWHFSDWDDPDDYIGKTPGVVPESGRVSPSSTTEVPVDWGQAVKVGGIIAVVIVVTFLLVKFVKTNKRLKQLEQEVGIRSPRRLVRRPSKRYLFFGVVIQIFVWWRLENLPEMRSLFQNIAYICFTGCGLFWLEKVLASFLGHIFGWEEETKIVTGYLILFPLACAALARLVVYICFFLMLLIAPSQSQVFSAPSLSDWPISSTLPDPGPSLEHTIARLRVMARERGIPEELLLAKFWAEGGYWWDGGLAAWCPAYDKGCHGEEVEKRLKWVGLRHWWPNGEVVESHSGSHGIAQIYVPVHPEYNVETSKTDWEYCARYGADYFRLMYDRQGNWSDAVRKYHSPGEAELGLKRVRNWLINPPTNPETGLPAWNPNPGALD